METVNTEEGLPLCSYTNRWQRVTDQTLFCDTHPGPCAVLDSGLVVVAAWVAALGAMSTFYHIINPLGSCCKKIPKMIVRLDLRLDVVWQLWEQWCRARLIVWSQLVGE
jgi:hypothetical protein